MKLYLLLLVSFLFAPLAFAEKPTVEEFLSQAQKPEATERPKALKGKVYAGIKAGDEIAVGGVIRAGVMILDHLELGVEGAISVLGEHVFGPYGYGLYGRVPLNAQWRGEKFYLVSVVSKNNWRTLPYSNNKEIDSVTFGVGAQDNEGRMIEVHLGKMKRHYKDPCVAESYIPCTPGGTHNESLVSFTLAYPIR